MTAGILFTGGGAVYPGVNFDGTNDYLTRASDLTGNSASKLCTIVMWPKAVPGFSGGFTLVNAESSGGSSFFSLTSNGSGTATLTGRNGGGATILSAAFGGLPNIWRPILISFDLSDTGKRHAYLGDSDYSPTWSTYTNDSIAFNQPRHSLGGTFTGLSLYEGDMAEVWVAYGQYIDFSVEANRRKFYTASGKPTFLGADGSAPTGVAPTVYFGGDASNFPTNRGTGGAFTLTGTLTDSTTNPSD